MLTLLIENNNGEIKKKKQIQRKILLYNIYFI